MAELGSFAVMAAFAVALYTIFTGALGGKTRRHEMIVSAENGLLAAFGLLLLSSSCLVYLFVTKDFQVKYVAMHSSWDLGFPYNVAAFWSGMEGSLLLWAFILSSYGFAITLINRKRRGALTSYSHAVLAAVLAFFTGVISFYENPFARLDFVPADGQGLNPLLIHPAMAIHPPMLYLGYVGFAVPFAFAMAALLSREMEEGWIRATRRWTLFPWFFLGTGQLLGGKWAYVVLGWGGYWGWDPVENSAMLPWLTGTAFLHSVMIQEKKGMLKVWNMALIILTFTLCIYGTFLTRSGVVSSVHAFAQSEIGPLFLGFVVLTVVSSSYLLWSRRGLLKSRNVFESPVSRESGFLMNNVMFLGATFAVFWGTMFPVFSEWVTGTKVTVGAPYFNKIMVPIGLILMGLTGIGPLLAWRHTSGKSLLRHFSIPALIGLAAFLGLVAGGVREVYALISLSLCAFVTTTIVSEFHRGALARRRSSGESYLAALKTLTFRNKRRYGGYVVHFGIVLLFLGFTGTAFNAETDAKLRPGESKQIRDYVLTYKGDSREQNDSTIDIRAFVGVQKSGEPLGTMKPGILTYYKRPDQQRVTEVSIHSTLREDLYVILEGQGEDGVSFLRIHVNPLVSWVWIGGFIVTLGTIIVMLPDGKTGGRGREDVAAEVSHGREVKA